MRRRTDSRSLLACLFAATLLATGIAWAECPGKNAVDKLSSNLEGFPDDLDFGTVAASGAKTKFGGTGVYVYLSNTDFSLAQMSSSMVSPIKEAGQGVLVLKLRNGQDPVAPGEYSPAAGYGNPLFASAELRRMKPDGDPVDTVFNLSEGYIRLAELTGTTACGTFELRGSNGTVIAGSFQVEIE